jgi:hypothetical protein
LGVDGDDMFSMASLSRKALMCNLFGLSRENLDDPITEDTRSLNESYPRAATRPGRRICSIILKVVFVSAPIQVLYFPIGKVLNVETALPL